MNEESKYKFRRVWTRDLSAGCSALTSQSRGWNRMPASSPRGKRSAQRPPLGESSVVGPEHTPPSRNLTTRKVTAHLHVDGESQIPTPRHRQKPNPMDHLTRDIHTTPIPITLEESPTSSGENRPQLNGQAWRDTSAAHLHTRPSTNNSTRLSRIASIH